MSRRANSSAGAGLALGQRVPWQRAVLWGLAAVCWLVWSPVALALDVPPLAGRINDGANLLSAEEEKRLEQRLAEYERGSGHQFALLTIPSLQGDPIEDFSLRVVERWQLGSEQADDGLLLLVVPQDRKMRIEVGYGLEGNVPDALAGRIIRNVLAPAFREAQYAAGIDAAFDALMKAAGGEAVAIPERPESSGGDLGAFGPLLALAMMLLFLFGGRRGLWVGGLAAGGYRHGGGGGFSGGFSGGGGGFGGGGASGSW